MSEEKKKKLKPGKLKRSYYILKFFIIRKYYEVKDLKIKDLIFIHGKTTLLFLLIIIFNLAINTHEIGFPYKFPSIEDCISTIEILIRSIVVLLSIIFSFTLLSFQIFNKYFGRFAFYDFFKKSHLKIMFTLFILNVSFLIYTNSYLKSCQVDHYFRNYGKLLFIEAVLFSLALTISIFPVMINLLSHSQSRTNLKSLFDSINDNNIMSYKTFFDQEIDEDEYQTNSFKIINEIGLTAIKDYDQSTIDIIVRSIFLKSVEVFKSDKSDDLKIHLYSNFRQNLKDFFSFAVKEKNSFSLTRILIARLEIEREVIKGNFILDYNSTYKGWDFNFDIEDFYSRTIQYNEDAISAEIVDSYRDFFSEIINLKFPETLHYNFDKPYENLDATNIVSTSYGIIENFIKSASSTKKTLVLKNLCNLFATLDITIVESKNTSETKNYLLQVNSLYKQKYLKALIEDAQIKNIEFQHYPYGIANSSEIINLKSAVILRSQIRSVDYLFQKGVLNNMILNDLKAAAFSIINNTSANINFGKKLLIEIVEKFDYLRGLIKKDDSSDRKDTYINLQRYLTYINSGYREKNIDYDLGSYVDEIISKFEYLEVFTKDLEDEGYIQNTNLF